MSLCGNNSSPALRERQKYFSPTPQGQRTLLQIGNKKTSFILNVKLRPVLPLLRVWSESYIRRKFMEYVIAVYRSRSVSMRAYNFLLSRGVVCSLISTPRSANVGCGLSVKMRVDAYRAYGAALSDAETFVGFFLIKQTMNGQTIVRL